MPRRGMRRRKPTKTNPLSDAVGSALKSYLGATNKLASKIEKKLPKTKPARPTKRRKRSR